MLILVQVSISSAAVGKLLLCLRCVLPQDKPMVFGLEMAVTSFFTFVPFKIIYIGLQDIACMSWTEAGTCQMHHSKTLALSVSILTSCLFLISGVFMVWVAIIAQDLELYENYEEDENYEDAGNYEINHDDTLRERRFGTPWPSRKKMNRFNESDIHQPGVIPMIISHAPPSSAMEVSSANLDSTSDRHDDITDL
ncbi:uncharacterized protein [Hetaerina americana]|uniref:uncharacterized protein n=1 Tax=Hetaerina americana TaxID=62018 RepID=UPI003A7F2B3E